MAVPVRERVMVKRCNDLHASPFSPPFDVAFE
jgi:hypothetical protein